MMTAPATPPLTARLHLTAGQIARMVRGVGDPAQHGEVVDHRSWLQVLADADANEERRYLVEDGPMVVAWSLHRLSWEIGVGVATDPDGERAAVWASLGPVSIEVFTPPWRRRR